MNWLDAAPFWERFAFGLAGGTLVWWAAIDLGAVSFSAIGLEDRARSPQAAALGYALVGTAVGALGLLHAIWAWIVVGLIVARFVMRCIQDRRLALSLPAGAISAFKVMPVLDKAAVVVTVCAWLTGAVAAALPATWWDPLAYHLPILARAVQAHTIAVDPSMLQTSFVLLGEAAALPAFIVGGTAGAAFATLGSGIVLVLLCARWAQRVAAGSGPIAMALVSCCALWIWLAPSFYVDIPFAMFAIGALLVASEPSDVRSGVAVAAGALAGAAAATKYTGLVIIVIALIALVVLRGRVKASDVARFGAAAIVLAGAWFLRTALATGDPVFPFLSASAPGSVGLFAQRYVSMTRSWCGGGASASDAVMLPWRLLVSPKTFCGDPGYALDIGSIFVLASLAAFRRTAVVLALSFGLTIVWFESSQQLRFLVPAVCLFAIAAAAGTVIAGPRLRVAGQTVLLALCALGVAVDWIPGRLDASNSVAPAFTYMAGAQSGDAYLTSRLEFYGAVRWVRDNGGGRVAALDDVRDYYFGSTATWFNPYYQPLSIDWTLPSYRRYEPLTAAGFRYLVVNANSAYVDRTPTGVDWRVLDEDAARGVLKPVYSRDMVTVFRFGRVARWIER
ncbi:MAG TPA: hypothetical protein VFO25_12385 [Candidatus Eremiobacteraceae bacterium]|nr:hypothetical protein [Candidatus Eremiobacteraceae bacterium]